MAAEVPILSDDVLERCPTGIKGLDEVTEGGLPRGRPTLVAGRAGCGKTLFGMEFLARGAHQYGEPGVFVSFEEDQKDLFTNFRSLGFDLRDLVARKLLAIDWVRVERSEIQETGEYDLEGLFIRIGAAVDRVGAKRIVLDTVESLFAGLTNDGIIRAELRRMLRFLKEKGLTTVVTGEAGGGGSFTRQGIEEYVSDCVVVLDHRVDAQLSTRRLRIAKYRGSAHGTNEYPFLIQRDGINLIPITALGVASRAATERVTTGIPRLDTMFDGQGVYADNSVLITGTAGTGKTTLVSHAVDAACRAGRKATFFAFEESAAQILRNLRSVGIDLGPWQDSGLLRFHASRPDLCGLEMHLLTIEAEVESFEPAVVVLDPITNFVNVGNTIEVRQMLTRLVDFLKERGVLTLMTSLTHGGDELEATNVAISSLVDTFVLLGWVRSEGERNRRLNIVKSRGMAHSNQTREFRITSAGIQIQDVYTGAGGLTGAARVAQEARERAESARRAQDVERRRALVRTRQEAFEARMRSLAAEFEAEQAAMLQQIAQDEASRDSAVVESQTLAELRHADREGNGEGADGGSDDGRG